MSFWYCMFPKWHNSSGVDHWSFWVDLTASICNGSRAKTPFLRYAALVMVMSYLWWPTCEQPTDSASLFSSFGTRARRSAGKASLQRQGMRFVFWECYTRRRIYFLNGQSDNDTRPLEEEKKKAGVYAAVFGVHRTSGGAGELSGHPVYKERPWLNWCYIYEDWRQRHSEVQRGDLLRPLAVPWTPSLSSSYTCFDHEQSARACALPPVVASWNRHPGADWLLSVLTLLASLKFTLSA